MKEIYEYAYYGDFKKAKDAIEEDESILLAKDNNQRFLIHWASVGPSLSLVRYLIEKGSPADVEDDYGSTPLILAASAGREKTVEFLAKGKVNINHQNHYGHSALQYACSKGWLGIAKILVKSGADVNAFDSNGATPLHRAASKGNLDVLRFLLRCPDIKVNRCDYHHDTPLHLACEEGKLEEAICLMKRGADLDALNRDLKVPLDLCSVKLYKMLMLIKGD